MNSRFSSSPTTENSKFSSTIALLPLPRIKEIQNEVMVMEILDKQIIFKDIQNEVLNIEIIDKQEKVQNILDSQLVVKHQIIVEKSQEESESDHDQHLTLMQ